MSRNNNDELSPETVNNQPAVHKTPRTNTWLVDALRIDSEEDNAACGERLMQIAKDAETELYDTREKLDYLLNAIDNSCNYPEDIRQAVLHIRPMK